MEPAYGEKAGNLKPFEYVNNDIKIKLENVEPTNIDNTTDSVEAEVSEEDANLCKECSKICYLKDLNEQFVCGECCPLENMSSKLEETNSIFSQPHSVENLEPAQESELHTNMEIKVEETTISNVANTYQTFNKSDFKANEIFDADNYIDRLGDSSYACTICPEGLRPSYTVATRARKHVKMNHFGYRFECTVCAAKYTKSIHLRKHYRLTHSIEHCNKMELTNYELKDFQKLDFNKHFEKLGESYVCKLCPETKRTLYKSTRSIRNHIKIGHYGHRYACIICNEKYTTSVSLKRHYKIVHSTNDVSSLRVELTGGHKLLPISHELAKEPRESLPRNSDKEIITPFIKRVNNIFICTLCPRYKSLHFKRKNIISRHIRFSHYGYSYVCSECGQKYRSKLCLKKHYTTQHHVEAPSRIELTRNTELLVQKSETKNQIKKIGSFYICTVCPKAKTVKYTNIIRVRRHIKIMHQGYRYECSVCGAKYLNQPTFKKHYRDEHNQEGDVKCTLTKKFRPDLAKLYKQQQAKKAEIEVIQSSSSQTGYVQKKVGNCGLFYFCTLCSTEEDKSKKYKFLERVERHIKIIHHGYRYQCTECGTKYSNLLNFKKHYKSKHNIAAPANIALTKLFGEDIEGEQIDLKKYIEQVSNYFVCKICFETKYKQITQLQSHIKMKHYGYGYECPDCDTSYSKAKDFRNHYKTLHNKEAPKRIQLTGRLAKSSGILSSAMPTHSTVANAALPINSKLISKRQENSTTDISKKRQLMEFEIRKTEKNKQIDYKKYCERLDQFYICTICSSEGISRKYKEYSALQYHIKHKHTDHSYECTECDEKFFSSKYLEKHCKKAHKQEAPLSPTITESHQVFENSIDLTEVSSSELPRAETNEIGIDKLSNDKKHWKKAHKRKAPLRPTITARHQRIENSRDLVEVSNSALPAVEINEIAIDKLSNNEKHCKTAHKQEAPLRPTITERHQLLEYSIDLAEVSNSALPPVETNETAIDKFSKDEKHCMKAHKQEAPLRPTLPERHQVFENCIDLTEVSNSALPPVETNETANDRLSNDKKHWKKAHKQEAPLRPTLTERHQLLENSIDLAEISNSALPPEETNETAIDNLSNDGQVWPRVITEDLRKKIREKIRLRILNKLKQKQQHTTSS